MRRTLADAISSQEGPMPVDACLSWVTEVAATLAVVHAYGGTHLHVSAETIVLHGSEDAPTATLESPARSEIREASQAGPATAPEQLLDLSSAATDIYALGLSLWWALCGSPFAGRIDSLEALIQRQMLRDRVENPRRINPAIPPILAELVRRMLSVDEGARPTATDVRSVCTAASQVSQPLPRPPVIRSSSPTQGAVAGTILPSSSWIWTQGTQRAAG